MSTVVEFAGKHFRIGEYVLLDDFNEVTKSLGLDFKISDLYSYSVDSSLFLLIQVLVEKIKDLEEKQLVYDDYLKNIGVEV